MIQQPVESSATFDVSDRGRYERMWAAMLYVLVEAWESKAAEPVRQHLASVADLSELSAILEEGRTTGAIDKLREVRHYMCHRDKREYWDAGRVGTLMQLDYNTRLHWAFSKVFLSVMPSADEGRSNPA